jgi:hypothetical protein
MNLKELTLNKTSQLNKVMESRFGFKIDYNTLDYGKAQRLNHAISENLNNIRKSYGIHTAEKNPKYMEMLIVQESLQEWINNHDVLLEGEVETAETVLAAKDMVDSIQDMISDVSKMMNEQLPPLSDAIRDQIGTQQSESFNNLVSQSLQSLLDTLNQSRNSVDNATRSLTGENIGDENDMISDFDTNVDAMGDKQDDFSSAEANAGGENPLGRELR